MNIVRVFFTGWVVLLCLNGLKGQTLVKAYKRTTPLIFDGIVENSEWEGAPPLPVVLHAPTYKGVPSDSTVFYLGYDNQYLYLAARMQYAQPGRVMATSKKRDAMESANDWLGLVVDSFNDNENSLCFFTTPSGLRTDMNVYNDGQGQMPVNISWNTFWDVLVNRTEDGYQAEIRVPFSSLRFQDKNGQVTMGISVFHYYSYNNESVVFPDIPPNWGMLSAWKASQTQKYLFEGLSPKNTLYVSPYALGGVQTESTLNGQGTGYVPEHDPTYEAGLDLKYSMSGNMTLDVTVNPDFAQVEADDQQVNLTRFSLFFPEKRLFFQERSSIFDFTLGGPNRLFYSRRIGLHEDGPVRIFGGLRLVGRIGNWDLGLLDMQTEKAWGENSTNYGVFRLRRRAFNENSYLGGMVVNKMDIHGNYNTGTGLDGIIRFAKNDYLLINYAQTFYNGIGRPPFSFENAKIKIVAERRTQTGFGYDLTYLRAGPEYFPEMGFEFYEDYWVPFARLWWGRQPGENSKWFYYQFYSQTFQQFNNKTNAPNVGSYTLGVKGETKNGQGISMEAARQTDHPTDTFFLSESHYVLKGDYGFNTINSVYNSPFGKKLMIIFSLQAGQYYDGKQYVVSVGPIWKVSSSLDFKIDFSYNDIFFQQRNMHYQSVVSRFRTTYMLNTKLSAMAFIQLNTLDYRIQSNVRVRFNPREGNDLYIVYNHGANTDRHRELPVLPLTSISTWALKYTHTFVVGK